MKESWELGWGCQFYNGSDYLIYTSSKCFLSIDFFKNHIKAGLIGLIILTNAFGYGAGALVFSQLTDRKVNYFLFYLVG